MKALITSKRVYDKLLDVSEDCWTLLVGEQYLYPVPMTEMSYAKYTRVIKQQGINYEIIQDEEDYALSVDEIYDPNVSNIDYETGEDLNYKPITNAGDVSQPEQMDTNLLLLKPFIMKTNANVNPAFKAVEIGVKCVTRPTIFTLAVVAELAQLGQMVVANGESYAIDKLHTHPDKTRQELRAEAFNSGENIKDVIKLSVIKAYDKAITMTSKSEKAEVVKPVTV